MFLKEEGMLYKYLSVWISWNRNGDLNTKCVGSALDSHASEGSRNPEDRGEEGTLLDYLCVLQFRPPLILWEAAQELSHC